MIVPRMADHAIDVKRIKSDRILVGCHEINCP